MRSSMRKAKQGVAQQVSAGATVLQALAGEFADVFAAWAERRPPEIDELAMSDVIGFFVENRKSAPGATAAAILRARPESTPEAEGAEDQDATGYLVHLFFLDKDGRPLIDGRQPKRSYLVAKLDGELTTAFGTNNIIIFN